ncbi:MAG: alpha/beta fold hydrolase [Xanthomonadales bacterium]|nr:alpha/beta fold hydrolase [Xanthomonadales bacterium]
METPAPVLPEAVRVQAADALLAGERHGRTGRGLLFAHGLGQSRGAWRRSAARLAGAGWQALAVDARGHGDSGRNPPDQPYRTAQMVDDLACWARAFDAPPVLVGASMGGLTGLAAQALHRPFAALVLVDITPRWEPEGVARILAFMRAHADGFESIEQAIDAVAAHLPHRPRKRAGALTDLLVADADGRLRWHWDPRLVEDIARDGDARQHELMEAARAIDVPTLLVTGGASDVVSGETIDEFLSLVPHARHQVIEHARHLVAGDDNDAFAQAVLDFLTPLQLRPAA